MPYPSITPPAEPINWLARGTDLLLSNERGSGICLEDDAVARADDRGKTGTSAQAPGNGQLG
jgi:hypothetical protein